MTATENPAAGPTMDPEEVARFEAMAEEWWDPKGKFRPLHELNPVRMGFVVSSLCSHFGRDSAAASSLSGLRILDIGCGGGLVAEPLARLGARVTGIDPSPDTVEAARAHAAAQELEIGYFPDQAEVLAARRLRFDAVLALEVIEHVPDPDAFLALAGSLVRPGGLMVLSTINRTLKSYALAIIGAEYILRWVPAGTHRWDRFVTPAELADGLEKTGFRPGEARGLIFDPLRGEWRLSGDTDVNYLLAAAKPGEHPVGD
ncbi:MAG: bifunctional 2-polyprenyl-6-hydroxyphenol methylase/3-demethylubiquinol 3-O-methyltransferase UbiG [Hyphomicrobiales bacterium]